MNPDGAEKTGYGLCGGKQVIFSVRMPNQLLEQTGHAITSHRGLWQTRELVLS
jgi:hypothetical protein